jgi:hypothetical protein
MYETARGGIMAETMGEYSHSVSFESWVILKEAYEAFLQVLARR